jgi:hypothetical protein
LRPKDLVSRIIRRIEPDPPREPEPSTFKKSGGWSSDRPAVGGATQHLSPDESAEAHRAGAAALVEMARQKDKNPGGPIFDQHIS